MINCIALQAVGRCHTKKKSKTGIVSIVDCAAGGCLILSLAFQSAPSVLEQTQKSVNPPICFLLLIHVQVLLIQFIVLFWIIFIHWGGMMGEWLALCSLRVLQLPPKVQRLNRLLGDFKCDVWWIGDLSRWYPTSLTFNHLGKALRLWWG